MTVTHITLADDSQSWITVEAQVDDALELTGSRRETLQVFGYVFRSRGPLRDVSEESKARTRAMSFASQLSRRHGGVPIRASWLARKDAA
jgi:hypothetical protein